LVRVFFFFSEKKTKQLGWWLELGFREI